MLDDKTITKTLGVARRRVVERFFAPKSANISGLEIADLIIHTAGRQNKSFPKTDGKIQWNPDYQEVFHKVPDHLSDGFFIAVVVTNDSTYIK